MSWSGSFTNEAFAGPGAYQAKNGVRCFVDMRTTPGPVVINAPASPQDHQSFVISWDNPDHELLSFASAEDFENPVSLEREIVSGASLDFAHGTVAFTFIGGTWEIFDWSLFGVALNTTFAIG